jgi:hypothetical protein
MKSGPDHCDGQRKEQDDRYQKHDDVFHESVVEKGFLEVGLKYEIDGINQVGEEEAGCDQRTCEAEPTQISDVLGHELDFFENGRVELSKKFFGKNIEAAEGNF